jgi:hypothetical protein
MVHAVRTQPFIARSNNTLSESERDEKQMKMSEINKINENMHNTRSHMTYPAWAALLITR